MASRVRLADTFWRRLLGLWGKKKLLPGEGLLLRPCRQVHTWFMSISLDIVFFDKQGEVVELISDLAPGRISPLVKGGYQVLELAAGSIEAAALKKGDRCQIG